MGMDVIGKDASSEKGEYFRNNVWYWRPLWNYCIEVAPDLCEDISGHYNDGDGLGKLDATILGNRLFAEIGSGNTKKYEDAHNQRIADLPRHSCKHCEGTGVRTDSVGQDMGMPTRALDDVVAIAVGRTHGWCNACNGEGLVDDWEANYPFTVENVREFAEFLVDCGGFQIC